MDFVSNLIVSVAMRRLDLSQVPVNFRQPLLPTELTEGRLMEWDGVPSILMYNSIDDIGVNVSQVMWWLKNPGSKRLNMMLGRVPVTIYVPASLLTNTCSDCNRPLALCRVAVEWEDRIANDCWHPNMGKQLLSTYMVCHACHLRKTWRQEVEGERGYMEIKAAAKEGWGRAAEDYTKKYVQRQEARYLKKWSRTTAEWWANEMKKNDEATKSALDSAQATSPPGAEGSEVITRSP